MRYEFICDTCGYNMEKDMSLYMYEKEKDLITCPKCNTKMRRCYTQMTFKLKGSGWASDGYVTKGSMDKLNQQANKEADESYKQLKKEGRI